MNLQVTGVRMDLGDALREHVAERFTQAVEKYVDGRVVEGHITFVREGRGIQVGCRVGVGGGVWFEGNGAGEDAYVGYAMALERMVKRLRRHHRRAKEHVG